MEMYVYEARIYNYAHTHYVGWRQCARPEDYEDPLIRGAIEALAQERAKHAEFDVYEPPPIRGRWSRWDGQQWQALGDWTVVGAAN